MFTKFEVTYIENYFEYESPVHGELGDFQTIAEE
jgi:hypothetical protein